MTNRITKKVFLLILISVLIAPNLKSFAQEDQQANIPSEGEPSTEEQQIIDSSSASEAQNLIEERKALEEELKKLEEEIGQIEGNIETTQKKKKTLQNQIYILKNKIDKLGLQIQQSNVMIRDIGLQISDTQNSIEKTSLKIENSRQQLASILRAIYEKDQLSFVEILLSEAQLSDFFDDLMQLETLNTKNQELLKEIKDLKSYLEDQKKSLDDEKTDLEKMLQIQLLQKKESENTKKEQTQLLEETKGKESEYQKLLAETQKKAQEIRSRIFELIGVPKAPTFGEALDIAKFVSGITGVRPAFLLAVMTQESNIGKNVGQCYLEDPKTGDGVVANSGKKISKVMKPSRDVEPFLQITKELGRNPYNTPVSCPIPSVGGYGGAMGPAQFIPSTWMIYRDRVKEITGKLADPWDIKDAFLAAALYLTDYGAAKQTQDAEWKAAMIYFSGSTNTKYRFYGDSVLNIAQGYEGDIETIEKGSLTQR